MEDKLTQAVIGCAMKVHRTLGTGFIESIYANALSIELKKLNIEFEREAAIKVKYNDIIIGDFRADLLIEKRLIVELKAIESLLPVHDVQVVNYLTATKMDIGILINFGAKSLEFKRKHRSYNKPVERNNTPIRLR